MTTYGDKQEPGIVTDLTSSAAVPTSGEAPTDLGIVGQADLDNASNAADTSKVYQVTRATKAVEWFGPRESSMLTQAIIDALTEGAFPVYAVATSETEVTAEDHSGASSTLVETNNKPIREDTDRISVNLDGTDLTINKVYDDVSTYAPASGECYVNPVVGEIEIPSTPSTTLEFDYEYFDYTGGVDTMATKVGDVIDFLTPLTENSTAVDKVNTKVANMEQDYDLALAVGGAGINVDPTNFSQSYDDSRTQVVYPTRFEDNTSAVAAYMGFKAALGLTETPINRRLTTNKSLSVSLNRAERGSLIDEQVVPLADESRGVRIVDDPTTVSDSNTDEQNLTFGFNRLVADYIIETTRDNQKPFIGRLNSSVVRGTLESMINQQLGELQTSNAVISYDVNVFKESATAAGVEMSVDLVEPLRFIENTVTVGNGG